MSSKSKENAPQRPSTIMRDINRAVSRHDIIFMPDKTVATLEGYQTTIQVEEPTRVPGLTRSVDTEVQRLRINGRFNSVDDIKSAQPVRQEVDNGYRIEHIPAEVRELYTAWAEEVEGNLDRNAIITAAKEISTATCDRYQATEPCRDCDDNPRYACRRSGWSRRLYRYPMVAVEDAADGKRYDVPFDAALYIASQPECLDASVVQKIDQTNSGLLSGRQRVSLLGSSLSREYITAATDGQVVPESDTLSFVNTQFTPTKNEVVLAMWNDPNDRRIREPEVNSVRTPQQILEALQLEIMHSYVERVDDKDYEAMLTRIQGELGKRGLNLLFGTRYAGMGETDWYIGVYDEARQDRRILRSSIDSYAALAEVDKQI